MGSSSYSTQQIYEDIKNKIVTLVYQPSSLISENQLAAQYGVSRAPVHEVLLMLQEKGLVKITPKIGVQVTPIDLLYMKKAFEVKRDLECLSVKLAIDFATEEEVSELKQIAEATMKVDPKQNYDQIIMLDDQFHRKVRKMGNNIVLDELLEGLQLKVNRLWYYTTNAFYENEIHYQSLISIANAIGARNYDEAVKWTNQHFDAYVDLMKKHLF